MVRVRGATGGPVAAETAGGLGAVGGRPAVVARVQLRPRPGHGPGAVGLEEELVLAALDAEPPTLAPVLAPGVADEPVPDEKYMRKERRGACKKTFTHAAPLLFFSTKADPNPAS